MTCPAVSIPRERGATSTRTTFEISFPFLPERIAPCTAAP